MFHIRAQSGKAVIWALLLAVLAAAAVYYFYFMEGEESPVESVLPSDPVVSEPEPEPQAPVDPVPEDTPPLVAADPEPGAEETMPEAEPLPPLPESDEVVAGAARELAGEEAVRTNLVTEGIVSRLVASVDALTRGQIPKNISPVQSPEGEFQVTEDGLSQEVNPETGLPEPRYALDPVNFGRYTPKVEVFESIDTDALAEQYRRFYPLMQQSYRELGYAEGTFQDRLVEVIDHLLETPEPPRPVHLVKPEAFYEFEDPELESLSAGQKLLIRMGPSNAARVKAKLSEIRAAIQTQRE